MLLIVHFKTKNKILSLDSLLYTDVCVCVILIKHWSPLSTLYIIVRYLLCGMWAAVWKNTDVCSTRELVVVVCDRVEREVDHKGRAGGMCCRGISQPATKSQLNSNVSSLFRVKKKHSTEKNKEYLHENRV